MARKSKKPAPVSIEADSDEDFAYIAGYTSGGAPYGVTWDEQEALGEACDPRPSVPPPPQKAPVSLNDLIQEMQMHSHALTVHYRRTTGEFVPVTDEYVHAAEGDDALDDRPEWEEEAIRMTAEVLADETGDFVPLPSQYDIHEYAIMEEFCATAKNMKIANDLFRSLSGRGAFRRFKEAVQRHGIREEWHRFRDEAYRNIAREWCEEHGVTFC